MWELVVTVNWADGDTKEIKFTLESDVAVRVTIKRAMLTYKDASSFVFVTAKKEGGKKWR